MMNYLLQHSFRLSQLLTAGSTSLSSNQTLQTVIDLLKSAATIGGGIWLVWGVVVLAMGLKDHNGQGIQSGIWQVIGGAVICAAGVLFSSILTNA